MRIFLGFLVLCGTVLTAPLHAGKSTPVEERKNFAKLEYAKCMSIAKTDSVQGVIRYIRTNQQGTTLISTTTTLASENCVADSIGLRRYQTLGEIADDFGIELVPIDSVHVEIKDNLPHERRVSKPHVRDYLIELAQYISTETNAEDGKPSITATSLVRSRIDQNRLSGVKKIWRRIKGKLKHFFVPGQSFADCSTEAICSTHLTGAAVDIQLPKNNRKARKLLEERLLDDREKGRILVILENKGNHFHVFVIPPKYQQILPIAKSTEAVISANTPTQ